MTDYTEKAREMLEHIGTDNPVQPEIDLIAAALQAAADDALERAAMKATGHAESLRAEIASGTLPRSCVANTYEDLADRIAAEIRALKSRTGEKGPTG